MDWALYHGDVRVVGGTLESTPEIKIPRTQIDAAVGEAIDLILSPKQDNRADRIGVVVEITG